MNSKQLHGKDKELVGYITGIIEKSCNMNEVDAIYRHCENLLYEDSGMADVFDEMMESSYGGTD
jgi:heterodisulfide reductase subunit B